MILTGQRLGLGAGDAAEGPARRFRGSASGDQTLTHSHTHTLTQSRRLGLGGCHATEGAARRLGEDRLAAQGARVLARG